MQRRIFLVFFWAFLLNLIWEHLHSALYVSYQGGAVTSTILLRAALFDAAVITLFACPFFLWELNSYKSCRSLTPTILFVGALTLFAILLEKWALATGRWVYADAMPLLPFVYVGLTPAIQLGLTGYLSITVLKRFSRKSASTF